MTPLDPTPPEALLEEDEEPTLRVGMGRRALAFLADLAAVALLSILWGPWLGFRLGLGGSPGAGGIMVAGAVGSILIALLWLGTEAVWAATPGKWLLGLRIGTDDGYLADRGRTVLRCSLKTAPLLFGLLALFLAFFAPGVSRAVDLLAHLSAVVVVSGFLLTYGSHRQALHDMLAHTAVYRRTDLLSPEET